MKIENFLTAVNVDFYTGVPDSQLSALCSYLVSAYGNAPQKHIVAANEGGAVGLAAGHYLATGKPAMVYLQNSGLGNIINPVCSLIHEDVYAIPMVFVVGWRGQPQTHDEPQHVFQGRVTQALLDCVEIENAVLTPQTSAEEFTVMAKQCAACIGSGHPFAFVVAKGAFEAESREKTPREYPLSREQAVDLVVRADDGNSLYISTTGKLSRELFEIRAANGQPHDTDFLTVGSMGHSIMIALGVSTARPDKRVFCLDGDGAAIMHMGSMAIAASAAPKNLIHIVFNNAAHESVGGIPTVGDNIDFVAIAKAVGYKTANCVATADALIALLQSDMLADGPHFIEVKVNLQVRKDLGRPTATPKQNRDGFMALLKAEVSCE